MLDQVKNAIRQPYAWPGGYPLAIVCDDGGVICPECAQDNWKNIVHSVINGIKDGWHCTQVFCTAETDELVFCEHCMKGLSAYE